MLTHHIKEYFCFSNKLPISLSMEKLMTAKLKTKACHFLFATTLKRDMQIHSHTYASVKQ